MIFTPVDSRPFIVCIHDATPAYAREIQVMIDDLAPLVGRRLSLGVVPDWNGEWPLNAHPDFCRHIQQNAEELLLHGCFHRRMRGWSLVTWLAEGTDEMNGQTVDDTRRTVANGQHIFSAMFGDTARGFLPPAWQQGQIRPAHLHTLGLAYRVGFFSLESSTGQRIPLATYSWDCGRYAWLGHVGHNIGATLQRIGRRVPVLAIHPRDIERGYWPTIVALIRDLLDCGYTPSTSQRLLDTSRTAGHVEVAV